MKRTSRIVTTAVAAMVLAALAAPVVSTAADHHSATRTRAAAGSVSAIGWPGDDAKPGHDPS